MVNLIAVKLVLKEAVGPTEVGVLPLDEIACELSIRHMGDQ